MKTILTTLSLALLTGVALADTEPLSTVVEQGLFEEEVNRDFDAAIAAYETAVDQFDQSRRLAATAIFRLAENYRRAGRTGEAEALYERVVREFHDHTELAEAAATRLPDDHLAALGAEVTDTAVDEEEEEIERLREVLRNSPDQFYSHSGMGGFALREAIENGHLRVVEFMLAEGFDVTSPWSGDGDSPLHRAVAARFPSALKLLLNEGADVNARDRRNFTPLHRAANMGYLTGAEILLEHSAELNARDDRGRTPLYFAADRGFMAIAEILLENSAKIDARTRDGWTPIHGATNRGFTRVAQLLVHHGADVDAETGNGSTALHIASGQGNLELAQSLLENGADVNAANEEGTTPLHRAVQNANLHIIELLLDSGANVNAAGEGGRTSLHHAVQESDPRTVEILLEHGAEVSPLDEEGRSPLDYAREVPIGAGDREISELLRQHGATPVRNRVYVWIGVGSERKKVAVFWEPSEEMTLMEAVNRAEPNYLEAVSEIYLWPAPDDEERRVDIWAIFEGETEDIELSNGEIVNIQYNLDPLNPQRTW